MSGRERGRQLRAAIFESYEKRNSMRRPQSLRMSEIGAECTRYLWIRYRWGDKHESVEGRMYRLFETGDSQENRMIADLRAVGCEVHTRDPDDIASQIKVDAFNGHSKGFLDAVAGSIPFSGGHWTVVECKTHSRKNFRALEKNSVEREFPKHYGQMQMYMAEKQLEEALYIAVNKDDDDIYCEFIPFDGAYVEQLASKAHAVLHSPIMPPKINESPTFFKCKMCSAADVCHSSVLPMRACRTCAFGSAEDKGPEWWCDVHQKKLTVAMQKEGCTDHRYAAVWVKGELLADQGDGAFRYQTDTGELLVDDGTEISEEPAPAEEPAQEPERDPLSLWLD